MHEYSLVRALADRVEAEARSRQAVAVHRLTVAIGAVSGASMTVESAAGATVGGGRRPARSAVNAICSSATEL